MGLCDCPLRSTHTKDGTNTKGQEESRGRLASLETRGRRRGDGLTAVWSAVAAGAATASLKIIFAMKDVYIHLIDGSTVACLSRVERVSRDGSSKKKIRAKMLALAQNIHS